MDRLKLELGNFFFYSLLLINFIRCFLIAMMELAIAAICVFIGGRTKHEPLWKYGRNKALAIDQWGNAELLGHPDETISSRLGRAYGQERYIWVKLLRISVDFIALHGFNDPDHCRNSIIDLEQQKFRSFDYEIWSWIK